MRDLAFVLVRIGSVGWGCLELSGFLWFYGRDSPGLLSLYWVAPASALILLAIAPASLWAGRVGRLALFGLALAGMVRSAHIVVLDLLAPGGPDASSVALRMITVAFILAQIWIRGRPMLKPPSPRERVGSVS